MTIRKIMLFVLISIVIISIAINGFILASLTDRHFQTYLVDVYQERIDSIIAYIETSIDEETISYESMSGELTVYLTDPITRIRLYSSNDDLLIDTSSPGNMHRRHMMGRMMGQNHSEDDELESFEIQVNGEEVGYLLVSVSDSIVNSLAAREFKSSLFNNSIISMVIALVISIVVGYLISKRMSKALKDTAIYAKNIEFDDLQEIDESNIVEVRQIRHSLDELSTRLNLKQESRKELIDQLIHQTRTPLTIIKTHVEAIEDGIIENKPEEMKVIYNEIENISSIISNLSGMIDAQKERDKLNLEMVNLSSLMKQIVTGLKGQFDKKEISLNLNLGKNINLLTDKYKLSQILYNLLTNAYKYTEENGQVYINCKLQDDRIWIEIRDTGIGISQNDQKKIFNAYYRSPEVAKTQGDGIGLYLVMENIKLLNGNIDVKSQIGEGSTFTISLPIQ